jgi:hypothetical protein
MADVRLNDDLREIAEAPLALGLLALAWFRFVAFAPIVLVSR